MRKFCFQGITYLLIITFLFQDISWAGQILSKSSQIDIVAPQSIFQYRKKKGPKDITSSEILHIWNRLSNIQNVIETSKNGNLSNLQRAVAQAESKEQNNKTLLDTDGCFLQKEKDGDNTVYYFDARLVGPNKKLTRQRIYFFKKGSKLSDKFRDKVGIGDNGKRIQSACERGFWINASIKNRPIVDGEVVARVKDTMPRDKLSEFGKERRMLLRSAFGLALLVGSGVLDFPIRTKAQNGGAKTLRTQGIVNWIIRNTVLSTGLPRSFNGDADWRDAGFLYDHAVAIMVLNLMGYARNAQGIINYYKKRYEITMRKLRRVLDRNNVYGILRVLPDRDNNPLKGIINAVSVTDNGRAGVGREWYLDGGPQYWLGMSLLQADKDKHLAFAEELAEFGLRLQDSDGGVRAGPRGQKMNDREIDRFELYHTEHNLDAYAFFKMLYQITGKDIYKKGMDGILKWLKKVYKENEGYFYQGIDHKVVNDQFATDVQAWSICAVGPEELDGFFGNGTAEKLIENLEKRSLVKVRFTRHDGQTVNITAFDFSDPCRKDIVDKRGAVIPVITPEWSAQVALAYYEMAAYSFKKSKKEKAIEYKAKGDALTENIMLMASARGDTSFLPYASAPNIPTGFGWRTLHAHAALAGAWIVFPMMRHNPFILGGGDLRNSLDRITATRPEDAQKLLNTDLSARGKKDIGGNLANHAEEINPKLVSWLKQNTPDNTKVVDYYLEDGKWVPYKVGYKENYTYGMDDKGNLLQEEKYQLSEDEQRRLNQVLELCTYGELGKPVKFRIVLGEVSAAWLGDIDHSSLVHVGERTATIWFGEGLFRDLLCRDVDDLRQKVYLHEKEHLKGNHSVDKEEGYNDLVDKVNERCKKIRTKDLFIPLKNSQEVADLPAEDEVSKGEKGLCVTGDTILPIVSAGKNRDSPLKGQSLFFPKRIVDVKAGDYVLSLNEETRKVEPHRINGLLDMGVKPVYKLTTASGRSIKTTANHPYLTKGGWIKVSELRTGDEIGVPASAKLSINLSSMPDFSYKDIVYFPIKYNTIITDLKAIGICLATGDVFGKGQWVGLFKIMFYFVNYPFLYIFRQFQKESFGEACKIIGSHFIPAFFFTACPEIRPDLRELSRDAKNSGLEDSTSSSISSNVRLSKIIPIVFPFLSTKRTIPCSENGNLDIREGSRKTTFSSDNPLNSEAIIHSPPVSQNNCNGLVNRLSRLFTAREAEAGEMDETTPAGTDIYWDRIVSIEYIGREHVYDIEVEGTHNFIGNGIFAHNTYMPKKATVAEVKGWGWQRIKMAEKELVARFGYKGWKLLLVHALSKEIGGYTVPDFKIIEINELWKPFYEANKDAIDEIIKMNQTQREFLEMLEDIYSKYKTKEEIRVELKNRFREMEPLEIDGVTVWVSKQSFDIYSDGDRAVLVKSGAVPASSDLVNLVKNRFRGNHSRDLNIALVGCGPNLTEARAVRDLLIQAYPDLNIDCFDAFLGEKEDKNIRGIQKNLTPALAEEFKQKYDVVMCFSPALMFNIDEFIDALKTIMKPKAFALVSPSPGSVKLDGNKQMGIFMQCFANGERKMPSTQIAIPDLEKSVTNAYRINPLGSNEYSGDFRYLFIALDNTIAFTRAGSTGTDAISDEKDEAIRHSESVGPSTSVHPVYPLRYVKRLIAKTSEEPPPYIRQGFSGIAKFMKKRGDRKYRFLYTKDIAADDLPLGYPTSIRKRNTEYKEPGNINVNFPEEDIFLVSHVNNGTKMVTKLAWINDGTPVAVKAGCVYSVHYDNRLTQSEYEQSLIADSLGVGPRVHGLYTDSDGGKWIVMDVVPGDFISAVKERITVETVRDLREINRRLIEAGKSVYVDFQYFVASNGRIIVIDTEDLAHAIPKYSQLYLAEMAKLLIESSDAVRLQALEEIAEQEPDTFGGLEKFAENRRYTHTMLGEYSKTNIVNLEKLKNNILLVREKIIGHSMDLFVNFLRTNVIACKEKNKEFVLAIDTDIANLEDYAGELFKALNEVRATLRKEGIDNVRIFTGDGVSLKAQLDGYIGSAEKDGRKFIISAVVKADSLKHKLYESVKDKMQVTAVDDTNMPNKEEDKLGYVPIIPILEMSIRKAMGQFVKDKYGNLPNIESIIEEQDMLIIYLLPKSEPIPINNLREKYENEAKLLISA